MADMHGIINAVRDNPKLGFLYLSPAVPKSSVDYHYYNLRYAHRHFIVSSA